MIRSEVLLFLTKHFQQLLLLFKLLCSIRVLFYGNSYIRYHYVQSYVVRSVNSTIFRIPTRSSSSPQERFNLISDRNCEIWWELIWFKLSQRSFVLFHVNTTNLPFSSFLLYLGEDSIMMSDGLIHHSSLHLYVISTYIHEHKCSTMWFQLFLIIICLQRPYLCHHLNRYYRSNNITNAIRFYLVYVSKYRIRI